MVSTPAKPPRVSAPAPPVIVSIAAPPVRTSLPAPPVRVTLLDVSAAKVTTPSVVVPVTPEASTVVTTA